MPDLKPSQRERRSRASRTGMLGPFAPRLERRVARALVALSRNLGGDWHSSIRRLVKFDAELLQVERVSFWTFCKATSSIHCDAGYVASMRTFEHGATLFESDAPEYFAALRAPSVLEMEDVQSDPRCRGLREYCASRGIASMLDVPVWLEGRLCGVLCHEHVGSPRRWSGREKDLAYGMIQRVASALAARAHTHEDAHLRRAVFLDAFARNLRSLDARELAARAVAMAVSMPVPKITVAAFLWMTNRQGILECVAFRHVQGDKQSILREGLPGIAVPAHLQRVVRQRQSLFIPALTEVLLDEYGFVSKERALLEKLAFSSVIVAPLIDGGKAFGAMSFASEHAHYDADDLVLAETVADRVASALENARLYDVAREAIRARDELLVLAAHELRTPLTALQLRADHLFRKAERAGDPAERGQTEAVVRDVRRFAGLVDHMLDALNVRAQGVALVRSPCDLATLVRDAIARLATRAKQAGSAISLDCPTSVPGDWDPQLLRKVVDILLDNAIKFGCGAPIDVSIRIDGGVQLTVRDHGIGIVSERLAAIFEPFERAVPKEHYGGLGLGLYIAKAIVDGHGGSVAVASSPGKGSSFVVRLPVRR